MPVVEPSLLTDDSCWWRLSLVVAPGGGAAIGAKQELMAIDSHCW